MESVSPVKSPVKTIADYREFKILREMISFLSKLQLVSGPV